VALDPARTPVLVAAGQCLTRRAPTTAVALATEAAEAAFADAPKLRDAVDRVAVVNILAPAPKSAASAVAERLGLPPGQRQVSTIGGNSPQSLVTRAAAAIAAGEIETVLIAGAEAQRSNKLAGAPAPDVTEPAGDPDEVVGDDRPGVGPAELAIGLLAPVHVYPLFESVLAARAGRTFEEQRTHLGALMARFTEVAAGHPVAWFPERRTPGELSALAPDNRLVAEPYPKRMCAVMAVDQGAAVLVTSLAAARRAGVEDRAVYVWSGAEAADVWFPSERPDPGTSPGIAAATGAALSAAGIGADDVAAFDFYSCFPCVVQMAAEAVGIALDDRRGLTVTGGLPYFGGPGNDYTLHAIATMADRIRSGGGTGLVTGVGWYATKHAAGVYGDRPPADGWRRGDTSAAQAAIDATAAPLAAEGDGPALVVASTVVAGRDGAPTGAPAIVRLPDGRQLAVAVEDDELPALAGRNLVGTTVQVRGTRYRPGP